jgi:hypothetical protein
MTIADILKQGAAYTNTDPAALEMLADFTDHRVGMVFDDSEMTLIVKDGTVAIEDGMRDDCHVAMKMKTRDVCEAIDNSYDLMEIRDKGELIKGDKSDPNAAVHFMATFPFFDAMVRLYEDDEGFKKQVDALKAAL